MYTILFFGWPIFCIIFGVILLLAFMMHLQSNQFYTLDVVKRKFSRIELELPSTPAQIVIIIKGLYQLPAQDAATTIRALKAHLKIDFIVMPLVYGAIGLLCWRVANKAAIPLVVNFFMAITYLQVLAWLCDVIENIYLLNKIKPSVTASSAAVHKAYVIMEWVKWGIVLIGTTSAIATICYFWLTGNYQSQTLIYVLIVLVEIIIFILATQFSNKKIKTA